MARRCTAGIACTGGMLAARRRGDRHRTRPIGSTPSASRCAEALRRISFACRSSRISRAYLVDVFFAMAPFAQELKPPANPARFTPPKLVDRRWGVLPPPTFDVAALLPDVAAMPPLRESSTADGVTRPPHFKIHR